MDVHEWFKSLSWQHQWIHAMVGWWVGEFGLPRTVADFGAGDGWWTHCFKLLGAGDCFAFEQHIEAGEYIPGDVFFVHRDIRDAVREGGRVDLVICLEVLEHIDRMDEDAVLRNLASNTGQYLLFSAAQPGQQGIGHINLRPLDYWESRLQKYQKIALSHDMTSRTRRAFGNIIGGTPFEFLARNVLVFART